MMEKEMETAVMGFRGLGFRAARPAIVLSIQRILQLARTSL